MMSWSPSPLPKSWLWLPGDLCSSGAGTGPASPLASTQTIVASISEEIFYDHCDVDGAYDDDIGDNGYDQIAPTQTIVASISEEN